MVHVLAVVGGILARIELAAWQYPPALFRELPAVAETPGAQYGEHRCDRLDRQILSRRFDQVKLNVARANCDSSIENHRFAGILTVLALDRVDEPGLSEVLRN